MGLVTFRFLPDALVEGLLVSRVSCFDLCAEDLPGSLCFCGAPSTDDPLSVGLARLWLDLVILPHHCSGLLSISTADVIK